MHNKCSWYTSIIERYFKFIVLLNIRLLYGLVFHSSFFFFFSFFLFLTSKKVVCKGVLYIQIIQLNLLHVWAKQLKKLEYVELATSM